MNTFSFFLHLSCEGSIAILPLVLLGRGAHFSHSLITRNLLECVRFSPTIELSHRKEQNNWELLYQEYHTLAHIMLIPTFQIALPPTWGDRPEKTNVGEDSILKGDQRILF